jgi:hypothetical protein
MPVLLGSGRRLFEKAGLEQIDLKKVQVLETGARTSLRFQIKKK